MDRTYKQVIGVAAVVLVGAGALWLVNGLQTRDERRVAGGDFLATIETDFGIITMRLLTNEAPNTVAVVVGLIREGFYDGLAFHQVDREAKIIGGGRPPMGREPAWTIPVEENELEFKSGAVALFHPSGMPDENKCMFLISLAEDAWMAEQFTIFGKVVDGMDVVERIAQVETTGPEGRPPRTPPFTPLEPVIIRRITVVEIEPR